MDVPSKLCKVLVACSVHGLRKLMENGAKWVQQCSFYGMASSGFLQKQCTSCACHRARKCMRRQATIHCRSVLTIHSEVLISTYTDTSGELMRAATFSRLLSQPEPWDQPLDRDVGTSSERPTGQSDVILFPQRSPSQPEPKKDVPLVRVRLSVHYRVHSRQMLCIGGSQIPFGWSFLSIAKVPMVWNKGDVWTAEVCIRLHVCVRHCQACFTNMFSCLHETRMSLSVQVELPVNTKIEYKYVILEEQVQFSMLCIEVFAGPRSFPDASGIQHAILEVYLHAMCTCCACAIQALH